MVSSAQVLCCEHKRTACHSYGRATICHFKHHKAAGGPRTQGTPSLYTSLNLGLEYPWLEALTSLREQKENGSSEREVDKDSGIFVEEGTTRQQICRLQR